MNSIKRLLGLLVFCLVASMTQSARADFKVCNNRSSTMWVSHSMYIKKATKINLPCAVLEAGGSCYYTAWQDAGWYQAAPGQCVTTWAGNIPNRYVYVRAEFGDGAVVSGNFPVFVQYDAGFTWHEDQVLHGSNCIVGSGHPDPCGNHPQEQWFSQVDVGSATNFTLNVN
jgi:uncharacterized membrane protein